MRILIVEDEKPAAQKLEKAIRLAKPDAEVVGITDSISETVDWLRQYPVPDLLLMDIQLSDGLSFRIFEEINPGCPAIFITAYDNYWQQAFEQNGIDYLLKPVSQEKLGASLRKYELLRKFFSNHLDALQRWQQTEPAGAHKKRFLVKRGADYVSIRTEDIAYFYATHKVVCLVESKGSKFILDQSLTDIERQLDPEFFYRVNRKYLVNMSAIQRIKTYPKSKLLLELQPAVGEEVVISQENVTAFKEWMGQ